MKTPIVCLAGPTASGKSASTLALAQRWPIEIVVVDSATIYREMDIGTAKPSTEERERVPHHLLDIRDPSETYSAAQFTEDAETLIDEILGRGRIPVLAGGTMMYYKALREGLNALPSADWALRAAIETEAQEKGWPALHAELAQVDPETASRLAPNDSQRLQRAIEIYRLSGKPMSQWLAQKRERDASSFNYITISLEPSDRLALHERIAKRYGLMLEQGLLEEVQCLHRRPDLHLGLPSIRCVGYRQLWEHLEGLVSLDDAVQRAIAATRQLAKRQLTWLRAQPTRITIDCLRPDAELKVVDEAATLWRAAGLK